MFAYSFIYLFLSICVSVNVIIKFSYMLLFFYVQMMKFSIDNVFWLACFCDCNAMMGLRLCDAWQDLSQTKSEASPPDGVLAVPLLRHQVRFSKVHASITEV